MTAADEGAAERTEGATYARACWTASGPVSRTLTTWPA